MRTPHELNLLLEQVVMLRREGKSRREIKQTLGPMSNATLNDALKDEPPPEWTRRPNAKDELRASARELRTQGLDYEAPAATGRPSAPPARPTAQRSAMLPPPRSASSPTASFSSPAPSLTGARARRARRTGPAPA